MSFPNNELIFSSIFFENSMLFDEPWQDSWPWVTFVKHIW